MKCIFENDFPISMSIPLDKMNDVFSPYILTNELSVSICLSLTFSFFVSLGQNKNLFAILLHILYVE